MQEEEELGQLGYAQELFRSMGGFSNFALSFSIISIITGIIGQYDYGLKMAGPAEMAFGWPLVSVFTIFVAVSMAELASGFPTSGAMYHWSLKLGGPGPAWFTAWFNILGLVTLIAVVDYQCAQFLMPVITPATGIQGTPLNTYLLFLLILLSHGLINHVGIRLVSWLNDLSVPVHILGVVVIVGALVLTAHRQPLGFFVQPGPPLPGHTWGYGFVLGLLLAQWTLAGYDASAQVSEETVDPHVRVPWGMVLSVIISSVFGYILLLALTLAIPEISKVLDVTDAGTPVPAVTVILQTALGSWWGRLVSLLAPGAMWFCGLASVTALSRTIFAFSRDDGMPLAVHWRRVSPRFGTPSRAIWLVVGSAGVLLIFSARSPEDAASTPAIVGSISVIALYVAYIMPVVLNWLNRRRGGLVLRGPWHLGNWSHAVNTVAIGWTVFIIGVLAVANDFIAAKTLAVTLVGLGLWYGLRERHRFTGPAWGHDA
ncbi:MAG TPA: amino acid permease [Candidatus Xenobia bacterium]|jgi:amino acid transporter